MFSSIWKSGLKSSSKRGGLTFDSWPFTLSGDMKQCPLTEMERGERGKDVFKGAQVSKWVQIHQGINFYFFLFVVVVLFLVFSCWRLDRLHD